MSTRNDPDIIEAMAELDALLGDQDDTIEQRFRDLEARLQTDDLKRRAASGSSGELSKGAGSDATGSMFTVKTGVKSV